MQIIDTNDPQTIREFEILKASLEDNQLQKGSYDITDFAMIRTSNFLSEDHILRPISQVPFVTKTNNIAKGAMYDILKEKNNVNVDIEEEQQKLSKEAFLFSPYSTQFRSTIHFTLNGLVTSHSKGNFNNQNFIIIDRLSNHLGKDNFRSLRMEDSFISGPCPLSEDAKILINAEKYQTLLDAMPHLATYQNIILYKGDEHLATEMVLVNMGIVPEKIETHSAEYTKRTPLYDAFFKKATQIYGVTQEKHWYSPEYKEDDLKNLPLWEIYNIKFYTEVFQHFQIDEKKQKEMIEYLTSDYISRWDQEDYFKAFILEVGLENYQQFVLKYNEKILLAIKQNIYPTNEEILADGEIKLKSDAPQKK